MEKQGVVYLLLDDDNNSELLGIFAWAYRAHQEAKNYSNARVEMHSVNEEQEIS